MFSSKRCSLEEPLAGFAYDDRHMRMVDIDDNYSLSEDNNRNVASHNNSVKR